MPRVRTAKSLAKRIDLQYFTRPEAFRTWRRRLSAALLVLALCWILYAAISHKQNLYSKGPLSSAHAVLAANCTVCHVRTATFRAPVTDKACLACHDAPAHNGRQTFAPNCGTCHVEHLGRQRLAEVSNSACVQCHGDLKTNDGQHTVDRHVSSFSRSHPEFSPLRGGDSDPGTINLNHFVHLQPTIRGPQGTVQMVCYDCHRPTNTQDPWLYSVAAIQPASQQPVVVGPANLQQRKRRTVEAGAGAYMTPIKYVNQCAACHLLQFDPIIAEPAPHDKPAVVHNFIIQKYTDYVASHPEALRQDAMAIGDSNPVLADYASRSMERHALTTSPAEWVEMRTAEAERLLWNKNCKLCHAMTEHEGVGLPETVKAVIPVRWLVHAEFDHQAHRMLSCISCHAAIPNSRKTSDTNIPGIALCRECHKSAGASEGATEGRCFECHSYHDWRQEKRINGTMILAQPKASGKTSSDGTNSSQ